MVAMWNSKNSPIMIWLNLVNPIKITPDDSMNSKQIPSVLMTISIYALPVIRKSA